MTSYGWTPSAPFPAGVLCSSVRLERAISSRRVHSADLLVILGFLQGAGMTCSENSGGRRIHYFLFSIKMISRGDMTRDVCKASSPETSAEFTAYWSPSCTCSLWSSHQIIAKFASLWGHYKVHVYCKKVLPTPICKKFGLSNFLQSLNSWILDKKAIANVQSRSGHPLHQSSAYQLGFLSTLFLTFLGVVMKSLDILLLAPS